MGEKCKLEEKLSREFCRATSTGRRVANKFSSPPVEKVLETVSAGYKYQSVFLFGPCPVRRIIQSSDCFFPASGNRNTDGNQNNIGNNGRYWSSSANGESNAYNLNFNSGNVNLNNGNNRTNGYSVRCVRDGAFIAIFNQPDKMRIWKMESLFLKGKGVPITVSAAIRELHCPCLVKNGEIN